MKNSMHIKKIYLVLCQLWRKKDKETSCGKLVKILFSTSFCNFRKVSHNMWLVFSTLMRSIKDFVLHRSYESQAWPFFVYVLWFLMTSTKSKPQKKKPFAVDVEFIQLPSPQTSKKSGGLLTRWRPGLCQIRIRQGLHSTNLS